MKEISIGQAQKLTAPAPFGLLATTLDDGTTNLMAVSWWTYLSNHPPMIGVCLSKKGISGAQIEKNGEFVLNIVGEGIRDAALQCGRCSGRDKNKAEEFGIALMDSLQVAPKSVCESKVIFECRLVSAAEASDHVMYMGEVVAIRADESARHLFAWDGYARLDVI